MLDQPGRNAPTRGVPAFVFFWTRVRRLSPSSCTSSLSPVFLAPRSPVQGDPCLALA